MAVLSVNVRKSVHPELGIAAFVHGITTEADGDRVFLIGDAFKIKYLLATFAARRPGTASDVEYSESVEMTYGEMTRNIGIKVARPKRL